MKFLITIAILLLGHWLHAQSTSLYVIGNTKGCPSEMNQSELKSIFMGEKQRWRSGNKISLAMMKTSTVAGKNICQKLYNMSEDELKKYWLSLVFQGKGEAPVFYPSANEVLSYVSENPGAIGIVDNMPQDAGIQVIMIEGKRTF